MKQEQKIFQLTNNNGLLIEFSSLGGRINSIKIPDNEDLIDIALGVDSYQEMLKGDPYIGAICGRFANRISEGKFRINEQEFQLAINNGQNHIHGGEFGFHTKNWHVEDSLNMGKALPLYFLELQSNDNDEYYPGNLKISVIYLLNDKNEFIIDITAITDKPTPINITVHPYFNLKGFHNGDVLDHLLEINSQYFTPLAQTGVTSGEIRNIKDTAMDFSTPKQISETNNSDYEQIKFVGGIDHNWVLNKSTEKLNFAARLSEPKSGRAIEVYTTQPGLQVYTGVHFNESLGSKNGVPFSKFCGVAIEPQNFPDAPNKAHFPKSIYYPGEIYKETIIYKFIW
jgi:aldose 1-epimerase